MSSLRRYLLAVSILVMLGLLVLPFHEGGPASAQELPPGGTFTDDDGNIHEGMIEAIAAAGITLGCNAEGTLYCPADPVTRAQMASFLARAFDLPPATEDFFPDDSGTHEDNINRIAQAGVTLGFPDGTFRPDLVVTREQMASFLARALGLAPIEGDRFDDVEDTPHEGNINAIAEAAITVGCDPEGTLFCPADPVRRDQMASFLGRALGLEPIVPSDTTTTTSSSTTTTSSSTTTTSSSTTTTSSSTTTTSTVPDEGETHEVDMEDNFFSPADLTIQVGDTVRWTNEGSVQHTSTSGEVGNPDDVWDSGTMDPGDTFEFTFQEPGTFEYFCEFHGTLGMTGTITVEE